MLPKDRRLISDYDFRKVRRKGRRIGVPLFTLYLLRVGPSVPSRFGFVVSKKIDKRATERNRVKRIFREGVRPLLSEVKDGYDAVFWIRQRALGAPTKEVWAEIRKALGKAGVISAR